MQPHTIASYDIELRALDGLLVDMASRAQSALQDASKALTAGDVQLAQRTDLQDGAWAVTMPESSLVLGREPQ